MAQDEITVGPGQIQFQHFAKPPLTTGTYTVDVEQQADISKIGLNAIFAATPKKFTQTQTFHVDGPHFGLLPRDVQAVYPPANRTGAFGNTLPHIVLRRRTLPWDIKAIDDGPNQMPRPWLALLLFHADEPVTESTVTLTQLTGAAAGPGILGPAITIDPVVTPNKDLVTLRVVDVPLGTFQAVAPFKNDLEFLAHVRQVNTGGKELLGLNEDGWFSVVLANRLPGKDLNTAYLVSLEGWNDRLRSENFTPTLPAGKTHCRMVSLANWSFTGTDDKASFGQLVNKVNVGVLAMGGAPVASLTGQELSVAKSLELGYVPLAYDQRSGERTVGWYHGPLAPVNWENVARKPFPSAEAALIYDEATGIFDVSYAVAWQMGRLLALSDAAFSKALAQWRQQAQQFEDRLLELDTLQRELNEEALFDKLSRIEAIANLKEKEKALIDFLNSLDDPQAAAAIGAAAFLKAASAAKAVPSNDGKQRLTAFVDTPAKEDLQKLKTVPLGPQRVAELSKLLFRNAEEGGPA
ncbi:MAG: hypothetical protein NTW28_26385 [Candidatus Solibacter sp.]|nr:hypothetical protein [Candidatus Solibacter sp.]